MKPFALLTALAVSSLALADGLVGKSFWTYGDNDQRLQYDFAAEGRCTFKRSSKGTKHTERNCAWTLNGDSLAIVRNYRANQRVTHEWKTVERAGALVAIRDLSSTGGRERDGVRYPRLGLLAPEQRRFENRRYRGTLRESEHNELVTIVTHYLPDGICTVDSRATTKDGFVTDCTWEWSDNRIVAWVSGNRDVYRIEDEGRRLADGDFVKTLLP